VITPGQTGYPTTNDCLCACLTDGPARDEACCNANFKNCPRWSCSGPNSCVKDPSGPYDSESGCLDGAYLDCGCPKGYTYSQVRNQCVTDLFYCA
jgi:hypothetical protein